MYNDGRFKTNLHFFDHFKARAAGQGQMYVDTGFFPSDGSWMLLSDEASAAPMLLVDVVAPPKTGWSLPSSSRRCTSAYFSAS